MTDSAIKRWLPKSRLEAYERHKEQAQAVYNAAQDELFRIGALEGQKMVGWTPLNLLPAPSCRPPPGFMTRYGVLFGRPWADADLVSTFPDNTDKLGRRTVRAVGQTKRVFRGVAAAIARTATLVENAFSNTYGIEEEGIAHLREIAEAETTFIEWCRERGGNLMASTFGAMQLGPELRFGLRTPSSAPHELLQLLPQVLTPSRQYGSAFARARALLESTRVPIARLYEPGGLNPELHAILELHESGLGLKAITRAVGREPRREEHTCDVDWQNAIDSTHEAMKKRISRNSRLLESERRTRGQSTSVPLDQQVVVFLSANVRINASVSLDFRGSPRVPRADRQRPPVD